MGEQVKPGQPPTKPKPLTQKTVGFASQDQFTQDEFAGYLSRCTLARGQYVLDVSESGEISMSRLKKEWIQREDLIG